MPGKILPDANLLVYAFDQAHPSKRQRSQDVLQALVDIGSGFLSTQVLGEFFSVITRKVENPLTVQEAGEKVKQFLETWLVAPITELILIEAIRGVQEHRFSYWDAQLWATALLNQATLVLSEDFQDGSEAEGIRFLNPFSERFDPNTLLSFS